MNEIVIFPTKYNST